jgi:hypothetical protein
MPSHEQMKALGTIIQTMKDETENYRRARVAELNAQATARAELEERYGQVWSTDELREQYEVLSFAAPFVIVRERKTGKMGTLEFQHDPRFYFNWQPE